jgi:hypothetical protein
MIGIVNNVTSFTFSIAVIYCFAVTYSIYRTQAPDLAQHQGATAKLKESQERNGQNSGSGTQRAHAKTSSSRLYTSRKIQQRNKADSRLTARQTENE